MEYRKKKPLGFFRISSIALGAAALGAFCVCVPSSLRAESPSISAMSDEAKKELEKKQDQLEEINKKIEAYNKIIDLKQQQRSNLTVQIKSLEAQAAKLELQIGNTQQRIQDLDQEMGRVSGQISEREKTIEAQKSLLSRLIRSYYDTRWQSGFQLLLSEGDAVRIMNEDDWKADTGARIKELLDGIESAKAALGEQHATLREKKTEADSLRVQLEQRNAYLENTKQSKEVLVTQTQKEEKKYDALVDDLEEKRKEIEEEIESLEQTKVDQLDVSKLPAFSSNVLYYPVAKPRVSQGYGKTKFTRWYTFHNGIDYAGATGDTIYAAGDGTVLATGNQGKYAYGKWIAIDHGNGLVTLYGHLSSQSVSKGDKVKKGGKIGLMGSTGYSTGPHVHFTVFAKNSFEIVPSTKVKGLVIPTGAHINPSKYLP
jgi:murein DD-endopeptidase MepM/ murein hydrolase activator NlpD